MKKTIIVVLFASLISTGTYAQGLEFGVKAGLNLSNQDISSSGFTFDTKSKAGFHGGIFLAFMLSDKLGIQPELLYSMQGSEYDFSGFSGKLSFDFVSVPILLRYNINEMISLHAGPQLSFLTKAEDNSDGQKTDLKDDFKGSDISAAIGAEVDLPARIGFGARYVFSVGDTAEDTFGAEVKNSVIQVYVKLKLKGN